MPYQKEYNQGSLATNPHECPFPLTQLGRRCAWMAGFNDARSWAA